MEERKEIDMKRATLILFTLMISISSAQVITIAEAREAATGDTVTTSGIVTTPNFAASGESDYIIQDETGGIDIYTPSFDAGLAIGDSITVRGEIESYAGKLEIVPFDTSDIAVVSQGNDLPPFQYVTLSGFLTDAESFESELVQVFHVEIVGGDAWPESGNNANITISDDDSATTVTMRVDRHTDVDEGSEPVGFFDLKGVVGQYDWGGTGGYQIMPRFQTDIETPDPNIITILEARNTAEGTTVTTAGFVTTPSFSSSGSDFGLQDATGGIVFYKSGLSPTLEVGDYITVTGGIDSYNGKAEIVPGAESDFSVISQGNVIPAVQTMTIAELLESPESFESELVQFTIASITDGTWPTSGSNENLTIADVSDSSITMRVDKDTDVDEGLEPQGTFNVTGIIDQYDSSAPYDEGYQIKPRYYSDIEVLGDVSPVISDVSHTPVAPTPDDTVSVSADVIDDGTVTVKLNYQVDSGGFQDTAMTATSGNEYSGDILPQLDGVTVEYFVSADDGVNDIVSSDTMLYLVRAPEALTAIYDIQYTTDPSGDSPLNGQEVTIGGIVTAEFWGGYKNRNFFVQDADGPYNGVIVFRYGGWDSFPFITSVGDTVHTIAEGDSVVITGTVTEYSGKTEIDDVTDVKVYGPAVKTITPAEVTPNQIMTGGADAEAYEGVLVKVTDVSVDDPNLGYGEWSITDGTNSVRVDDNWDYYYWPEEGHSLAEVVGCLDYAYSDTKIQPRLARDVVESGLTRIQRAQQVLYSDLLEAGLDSESDISYMYGDTITATGIVTMPTGLSYAGDGIKFIFSDSRGGPWSAILSYAPDSSAYPRLYEGDSIIVSGYISEYPTGPSNMTELFITEPIDVKGIGAQPPVEYVKSGDLRWPPTAEQWGNVMVQIGQSVVVEHGSMISNDGGIKVDDGTGEIWIDHDSDSIWNYWTDYGFPPIGTTVDSVRGWVYHHYGDYSDSTAYKLAPLYVPDIAISGLGVADQFVVPSEYALYHNYPNPFNPETQITFKLGSSENVRLVIYDILGRQVRTLTRGQYDAGLHSVTWDGRNNVGKQVSSGVYVYRIKAGEFIDQKKMILIR